MGLFDFFKKTDKSVAKENAIDSSQLVQGMEASSSTTEVETKLSFHPDWDVPQEQQYIFNFLANDLAPLKPNQLSLSAINIDVDEATGAWNVKAFFRSSLSQAIQLENIDLFIMDKDNNKIASKTFNFAELGTIPAESARPWVFVFDQSVLNGAALPEEGWQLAFNLVSLRGHQLDLDASWKKQLPEAQQKQLAEIVKTLPALGKTEVNFTGFQALMRDDQSVAVSVFIRNGNDMPINLEQIPLEVMTIDQEIIAKGSFKMDPVLTVDANSTKPWTFIFPAELVVKKDATFDRWIVRVAQ